MKKKKGGGKRCVVEVKKVQPAYFLRLNFGGQGTWGGGTTRGEDQAEGDPKEKGDETPIKTTARRFEGPCVGLS